MGPREMWLGTLAQSRAAKAGAVALIWLLSCLPVMLGRAVCPVAEILGIPCPGCGMTRAVHLLERGDWVGSLHMQPLAVPSALASLLFMVGTVWATAHEGNPMSLWRTELGRVATVAFAVVQAAVLALWVARFAGFFGGPVPV